MFFKIGDTVVLPNEGYVAKTAVVVGFRDCFVRVKANGWKRDRSFLPEELRLVEKEKCADANG